MAPPRLILTTRPRDDAARDITLLEQRGARAISAPMLEIRTLSPEWPDASGFDGVVLTSRHAAALIRDPGFLSLPCFCVGNTTSGEARKAGFTTVITGPGDGDGLTGMIRAHDGFSDHPRLLWASAVDTGFNIKRALDDHGIQAERLAVYEAATVDDFTPEVLSLIRDDAVAVVLAHSGRAGEHFTRLLSHHGLEAKQAGMTMIAISQRAAGLCGEDWHTIRIADQPKRSAMLDAAIDAIMHDHPIKDGRG